MVHLSNSDFIIQSYSKTKQPVFESLTKQQQILRDKIENGNYGYGIKFILDYTKEYNKFNDITLNGYKLIVDRFKTLCSQYLKEPISAENGKQNLNQTYTNIVDETLNSIPPNDPNHNHNLRSKKLKKRTLDEADMNQTNVEESNALLNQTTTKTKKKKKLKAKKMSKLDTTAELVAKNLMNQSIKSEKLSVLVTNNTNIDDSKLSNPSKKVRLSTEQNTTLVKKSTKTKKKRKSSKKKSSVLSKKSSVKSSTGVSASFLPSDSLSSTRFEFNEHKTPMRNNLIKLQSILESNTKTIKAEKRIPSVHASGKVKQMVELVEARMKSVNNTPNTVVKQTKTQQVNNSVLNQTKKLNAATSEVAQSKKLRSSIDERKKRISNSKNEIKRQSTKRINAFLNDLAQTTQSTLTKSTNQPIINPTSTVKKKLNYQQVELKIKEEPIERDEVVNNSTENKDSLENKAKKMTISNLIASNSSIHQQYRLKHTSSMNSERKNSFNKFLERNTPSKLTKHELDEKRKVELMYREEKDQKRLQEREKQLLEKIEQNKKKREEKMKKIDEIKLKQQEDAQKKKEELEAKQREAEENKKRLLEEKRKEEFEKQRIREQRIVTTNGITFSNNHQPNVMGSAQKAKPFATKQTNSSTLSTPAKGVQQIPFTEQTNKPNKMQPPGSAVKLHSINELSKTPVANKLASKMVMSAQKVTPYANKKKAYENYDICDLNSGDETDDDEEPSKPIPEWAKEPHLQRKAIHQCHKGINYTKLFRASCQNEIILENIFKIKRKKFTERSSSAIWNSPPVWRTNGINGDESFRQLHNL